MYLVRSAVNKSFHAFHLLRSNFCNRPPLLAVKRALHPSLVCPHGYRRLPFVVHHALRRCPPSTAPHAAAQCTHPSETAFHTLICSNIRAKPERLWHNLRYTEWGNQLILRLFGSPCRPSLGYISLESAITSKYDARLAYKHWHARFSTVKPSACQAASFLPQLAYRTISVLRRPSAVVEVAVLPKLPYVVTGRNLQCVCPQQKMTRPLHGYQHGFV